MSPAATKRSGRMAGSPNGISASNSLIRSRTNRRFTRARDDMDAIGARIGGELDLADDDRVFGEAATVDLDRVRPGGGDGGIGRDRRPFRSGRGPGAIRAPRRRKGRRLAPAAGVFSKIFSSFSSTSFASARSSAMKTLSTSAGFTSTSLMNWRILRMIRLFSVSTIDCDFGSGSI